MPPIQTLEAPDHIVGCPDCGLVQSLPPPSHAAAVECGRCGHSLAHPPRAGIAAPLGLSIAALLLMLPAALAPLMSINSFGVQRRSRLPSGVQWLWNQDYHWLALIVFLFSVIMPFLYLLLMVWVLGAIRLGTASPIGRLFRWAMEIRPWAMIEVYLIGCCVAYSRLERVGTVEVNTGGWCLVAATLATLLMAISLDERSVWNVVPLRSIRSSGRNSLSCVICALVLPLERERSTCPRCNSTLHRRKPESVQRTLALVFAGFLLYLPANTLPVLTIERFGREQPNTILSGVRELMSAGLWPLAVIVFTASIVVPLMKLLGLSMMLVMTRLHSRRWLVGRTRLYRFIELIGRWSSIDLFMISILVGLVRFGTLTTVRAEPGAIAFAAVVVITMFASRSFDPRVMWDAGGEA
jgi:paraquat-inducible protein A